MTTVVAAARDGLVAMAADTMVNVYDRPVPGGVSKILRVPAGRGQVLLGCAGFAGIIGVLAAGLHIDGEPEDDAAVHPWAHAVAHAVTDLAVDAKLTDDSGRMDAHLILGWRGQLWTLGHMVAVPARDGVAAIGSGEGPAIGALDALLEVAGHEPLAQLVARAARIAAARDRYSGGPLDVHLLPGPDDADAAG